MLNSDVSIQHKLEHLVIWGRRVCGVLDSGIIGSNAVIEDFLTTKQHEFKRVFVYDPEGPLWTISISIDLCEPGILEHKVRLCQTASHEVRTALGTAHIRLLHKCRGVATLRDELIVVKGIRNENHLIALTCNTGLEDTADPEVTERLCVETGKSIT